jgi:hypothetical protein
MSLYEKTIGQMSLFQMTIGQMSLFQMTICQNLKLQNVICTKVTQTNNHQPKFSFLNGYGPMVMGNGYGPKVILPNDNRPIQFSGTIWQPGPVLGWFC